MTPKLLHLSGKEIGFNTFYSGSIPEDHDEAVERMNPIAAPEENEEHPRGRS